jgi:hypothetical protein
MTMKANHSAKAEGFACRHGGKMTTILFSKDRASNPQFRQSASKKDGFPSLVARFLCDAFPFLMQRKRLIAEPKTGILDLPLLPQKSQVSQRICEGRTSHERIRNDPGD